MTSGTQKTVGNKKLIALGLVGFGLWNWSVFIVSDGSQLATVGRFTGMGMLLLSGAYLVWRSYRLNVREATQTDGVGEEHDRTVDSDPAHEQETFDWLHDASAPEWFMRYSNTDLRLLWTWVVVAVIPVVFQWGGRVRLPVLGTIPFPWYVFPVLGIVGFYISHRVFVGPLTTSAEGNSK